MSNKTTTILEWARAAKRANEAKERGKNLARRANES